MPELEEGTLWIRAIFPVHVSLDAASERCKQRVRSWGANVILKCKSIVTQAGRPDDGTDPGGFNNVEFFVPLRREADWPAVVRPNGEHKRRTRQEIVEDMSAELYGKYLASNGLSRNTFAIT